MMGNDKLLRERKTQASGGAKDDKLIPISLAANQVRAYACGFVEAVRMANIAVSQRDRYAGIALRATCSQISSCGNCPDFDDDPCMVSSGGYCRKCRDEVRRQVIDLER